MAAANKRVSYTIKHPLVRIQFDTLKEKGYGDSDALDAVLERAEQLLGLQGTFDTAQEQHTQEVAHLRDEIAWLRRTVDALTHAHPTPARHESPTSPTKPKSATDDEW